MVEKGQLPVAEEKHLNFVEVYSLRLVLLFTEFQRLKVPIQSHDHLIA